MINLKPQVYQTLSNDSQLTQLLGGKRVYQLKAPNANEYPRITFFELNNINSDYANDSAVTAEIRLQIDVWSRTNYDPIADRVNTIMESMGFSRYYSIDLYESDTDVFHKSLRYLKIVSLEG
jgi:hypothetical protein